MTDAIADVERMRDYLADRLSDDEARDFESRLGREPTLVSELELALGLREGLSELAERKQLVPLIRASSPARAWWPSIAVAATIGAVAVSLWAFHATHEPILSAVLVSGSSTEGVSAQYTFRTMRGTGQTPILALPASGAIGLDVAPVGGGPAARYAVALAQIGSDGHRSEIASLSDVAPDGRGVIRFYAVAARLVPGTYLLAVSPAGQPGTDTETFTFALIRATPGITP